MTAEIRELDRVEDLRKLADLFAEIWGRKPGDHPISSDILKALAHSGNYVSGAFEGATLIGGLVGWLGGVPPHETHLHSHILGVLPGSDARGLGFELKQHQRRWCLAREVRVMEWTTDPLIRRNVYFNLTKLGASAPHYLVDFYGEMTDGINAGEQSDRLLIRWKLDSPEAQAAAGGHALEPDLEALKAGGAATVLSDQSGKPAVSTGGGSAILLCRVPDDIVAVRRTDPAAARAWRLALRAAISDALAAGYTLTGATRSGWYVLESGSQ